MIWNPTNNQPLFYRLPFYGYQKILPLGFHWCPNLEPALQYQYRSITLICAAQWLLVRRMAGWNHRLLSSDREGGWPQCRHKGGPCSTTIKHGIFFKWRFSNFDALWLFKHAQEREHNHKSQEEGTKKFALSLFTNSRFSIVHAYDSNSSTNHDERRRNKQQELEDITNPKLSDH